MFWDGVRSRAGGEKGRRKAPVRKKKEKKRQVLFAPRIASPSIHQQHQSKANKKLY